MAKDPATLWYWNDWYSGTVLMSRFLKGCYMDLLHAQFNNGRLSLEEIKTCLGADFGSAWPALQKKFKQDENGLFFNERAEQEKLKRQAYVDSRSKNKLGKTKSYDTSYENHMTHHMENRNRNRDKDVNIGDKGGVGEKEPSAEIPVFQIEHCLSIALNDQRWVEANKTTESELTEFNGYLERQGVYEFNPLEYKRYFSHWKPKKLKPETIKLKPWKIKTA